MKRPGRELRVHLDHLIERQSLRYVPSALREIEGDTAPLLAYAKSQEVKRKTKAPTGGGREDSEVRYEDIGGSWFTRIRKPDFQRETNAWSPERCVSFLDSVVTGRIVPSVILWHNLENTSIYVLDGAHRLSVVRAWMQDDWGDSDAARRYYVRADWNMIVEAAHAVREQVNREIGSYPDFEEAYYEYSQLADQGIAQKPRMGEQRFGKAKFYEGVVATHKTMYVQWDHAADYRVAEDSFLRINRGGQPLNPWEACLIEHRNGSYARSIMCIANGGESGHYWPEPSESELSADAARLVQTFEQKAATINERLFVPPFSLPIADLNVPTMVAPAYFQRHKYLLEVLPLLTQRQVAVSAEDQIRLLKRDVTASPEALVRNGNEILTAMHDRLEHLAGPRNNPKSLAVVPLLYWYNQRAQYVRVLFYGFTYWLFAGQENDVLQRKLVFAANRGRFERILFDLKPQIATLQEKGGAGLKGTHRVARFFQSLVGLLNDNKSWAGDSPELRTAVLELLSSDEKNQPERPRPVKTSRAFSLRDKTYINIREIFEHSIRCHICDGVVNLQQGGIQYDHVYDYARTHVTDPDTGKPTHAFCNNNKPQILANRRGDITLTLPFFDTKWEKEKADIRQLSFWGEDGFPG